MKGYKLLVITVENEFVVCIVDESHTNKYWKDLFEKYMLEIIDEKMDIAGYGGIIKADDVIREYKEDFIEKLQSNFHIKVVDTEVIDFRYTRLAELDLKVKMGGKKKKSGG